MSFSKELLLRDVIYSGWANQHLLDGCSVLTDDELERDLGTSHTSILTTLQHICDGERVWLECLSTTADLGSWRLPTTPAPQLTLEELRQKWPELWEGYRLWLGNLSESHLTSEIRVQLPGAVEPLFPRWKILRHVLDHSQFHRGQVVGMFRALGHTPPAINRMDHYMESESRR